MVIQSPDLSTNRWYRRFWILSLLAGVEEAGASPIDLRSFNILAYLANAVSACYGIPALDPTVLKQRDGPLYPHLIWDVDRLVGMRLVDVSDVVVDRARKIRNVSYSLTEDGFRVLDGCTALGDVWVAESNSLRTTALAFARNRNHISRRDLLAADGNYADAMTPEGAVVDFGQWSPTNATANSVEFILSEINESIRRDPAIGVNLYLRYLGNATNEIVLDE
jgi:hypothetical protein